jgi:hypothetical protein
MNKGGGTRRGDFPMVQYCKWLILIGAAHSQLALVANLVILNYFYIDVC